MSDSGTAHVVAAAEDIDEGEHVVVEVDGREIGVFNVGGEYHAYTNWCPHHGGPVCDGSIDGTTEANFDRETLERDLEWVKEGQVLRCPWHAWEFDVTSGESLHSDQYELIGYDVNREGDDLVLRL